jgi:hypothetical protein
LFIKKTFEGINVWLRELEYNFTSPSPTYTNQFLAEDTKKDGADHVCSGPGKRKNIFEKILKSKIHAMKQHFSGSVRLGLV